MKKVIKTEFEIDVPQGYEYVDFREPEIGEYILGWSTDGWCTVLKVTNASAIMPRISVGTKRPIIKKARFRAKIGDSFWHITDEDNIIKIVESGNEFCTLFWDKYNYFELLGEAVKGRTHRNKSMKEFHEQRA